MPILQMVAYPVDDEWQPGANTVAYYPLNSTTTVNDMSGNGNTLTNQGATFGIYGGVDCVNTTGKSLYGPITNLPTGNSARTIIVRAYLPSATSAYRALYGYGQNSSLRRNVLYNTNSHRIVFSHYTNDMDGGEFPVAQWCMITYTYDGTTAKLYLNDTLVSSLNVSINTASSNLVISGRQQGNETFPGYLSRFILENKTRTHSEIVDYYNKTIIRFI